jgi:hypothetical protein
MATFKRFTHKRLTQLAFAGVLACNTASAAIIPFELTDFLVSTETTLGVNLSAAPSSAPALPADTTFLSAPTTTPIPLTPNEGNFLRLDFVLPDGFSNLAFDFTALVNDEFAVYLNDTVIAIQDDASVENFTDPLPGFSMNTAGTAVDTSSGKLDYLLASGIQPLFQAGANELSLFGTDSLITGSINIVSGSISFDAPTTPMPVPAPATLALMGLGLAGLDWKRRKS